MNGGLKTSLDLDNIYFHIPSNIISLPLAFVRSGGIYLNDGIAYYVGHALYNWSRVVLSAPVAYFFGVDPAEVYPSFSVNRWYAFPPR